MKDPTDQTLDRIVQDYNWRSVWNDPKTEVEIEQRLTKELQGKDSLLVQTSHKAYFEEHLSSLRYAETRELRSSAGGCFHADQGRKVRGRSSAG